MERPLTEHMGADRRPPEIAAYKRTGGYAALAAALKMQPKEIVAAVDAAHLRGRGGAGFPTGRKWRFVPAKQDALRPRYLVVNADEMEPATFKDRTLLEGTPHQLIEGVVIAAYAIQADIGYIFLRQSYRKAARRLERAIEEAYREGVLGRDIRGSGFGFELYLHQSAGRYICGEETALLSALEGRRALPRAKPPFPPVAGLWGKPTVVNNVETICNIPPIVARGAKWFRDLSLCGDGGTKIYGVSGRVKRPGVWELPLGTTIREILEEHAGGMADGYRFRAVIPGGGSTDFLTEAHLDTPMDFDALQKAGSRLGTGCVLVLDDRTCPVAMVLNLMRFFAQESCGWCTPCREGLPWIVRILEAVEGGQADEGDLAQLRRHVDLLKPGHTFCARAPGAADPLKSALEYFEADFVRHNRDRRCPWR
ncbi:MAG: NADH-quinone oxidoreductase subunit NuoF [Desulfosarcinaceae bacterium]